MEMAVCDDRKSEPHAAAKISFPVTEEDWGGVMDAREAFCIAVKFYRSGDWNPAVPTFDKVVVRGQPLTLRQVCGLCRAPYEALAQQCCQRSSDKLAGATSPNRRELRRWQPHIRGGRKVLASIDG
jgi:hypothetical protein